MKVGIDKLKNLYARAVLGKGFPSDQADQLADWLMWATLRGNVQDGRKVAALRYEPTESMGYRWPRPGAVIVDAKGHHPVHALNYAISFALRSISSQGSVVVGVRGTSQSSGALGYFVEQLAKQDLVAVLMSSTIPLVSPYGAAERVIGTNPIAVGIPGNPPVIWDESVAAISYYGVLGAKARGEQLPSGLAVDATGALTTDPAQVVTGGAILAKGSLGSGLGVVIQLLAARMLGEQSWGHLLIVFDPKAFSLTPLSVVVAEFTASFKAARKQEGAEKILLPGERGFHRKKKAEAAREVEIPDDLYKELGGQ